MPDGDPKTVKGFGNQLTGARASYNPIHSYPTLSSFNYYPNGLRSSAYNTNQIVSLNTRFLYDGTTPVVEIGNTGNILAINTFGANGLVHRLAYNGDGSSTYQSIHYLFDETGNTTSRLDDNAQYLAGTFSYGSAGAPGYPPGGPAYGAKLNVSYSTALNIDPQNPDKRLAIVTDPYFGYKAQYGYYYDYNTHLYLCTYRFYDPGMGRWLTRDPIGYDGGINLYEYAGNNPVMNVDPIRQDIDAMLFYDYSGRPVWLLLFWGANRKAESPPGSAEQFPAHLHANLPHHRRTHRSCRPLP